MTRSLVEYLEDIVQESQRSIRFLGTMTLEELEADDKTTFAIIRALEIIGEASRNVPKDIQDRYPDIAWRRMIAMRNILAHNYAAVDIAIIHNAINSDLPPLIVAVQVILADLQP